MEEWAPDPLVAPSLLPLRQQPSPPLTLVCRPPIGYWDPLGLNANADAATFRRRRAVEIKHGRVAMFATMGYIVPEYYKFPGATVRSTFDHYFKLWKNVMAASFDII